MIEYNDDRKELQVDRMIDDFIAECEIEAANLKLPLIITLQSFCDG